MEDVNLPRLIAALLPMLVLGEAALAKIIARETPSWFVDQFKETWLGKFPAGPQWWLVTLLELGAAGLLFAGLVTGEVMAGSEPVLLQYGMLLAALVFVMLTFGLRVAQDFAGAANGYFYTGVTLGLYALL
ncbi:MAG: hypothetical protein ACI81R_001205 [Bradymonadia bacterium]|jgi:hypothetical protein